MTQDTIRELHVKGLRTLIDVRLKLNRMTVLTGENGSGKSTLIEALEILRKSAEGDFLDRFIAIHGGFDALKSVGSARVALGLRIEGRGLPLCYSFEMENSEELGLAIAAERLALVQSDGSEVDIISRAGRDARVLLEKTETYEELQSVPATKLLLSNLGLRVPHSAVTRMLRALQRIEVHLPFAVLPDWVDRSMGGRNPSMRISRYGAPSYTLERLGRNLANVYFTLREQQTSWAVTMDYVRLGLGEDIEDIFVEQSVRGLELLVKYRGFEPKVPARSLSDGTLGYLAYVALFRLASRRTILAFDEPEGQLHPNMSARVAQLLQSMSSEQPVLVATHSDRFLDAISDPADSIVLCSLGRDRDTQLFRPDRAALSAWLQQYRGYGDIRRAGHEGAVTPLDAESSSEKK